MTKSHIAALLSVLASAATLGCSVDAGHVSTLRAGGRGSASVGEASQGGTLTGDGETLARGEGAGPTSGGPEAPAAEAAAGRVLGVSRDGQLGSDWHGDADGDGVPTATDTCPDAYDPSNAAATCDAATDAPSPGKAIGDLRAEHVTPYGAWFSFRSNESSEWGYYAEIAWAEDRAVAEAAGFDAAVAAGRTSRVRVNERLGERIPMPAIVTTMTPGTKYFAAVRDSAGRIGKVLEIKTAPAPVVTHAGAFPRVYATPTFVSQLKARAATGDAGFAKWKTLLASKVDRALGSSDIEDAKYCNAAALLASATGDAAMLGKAKALHGKLAAYFAAGFEGNGYRWADAALGTCTDLLWNDLDVATREAAIATSLRADEAQQTSSNYRIDDTDEAQSSVRSWLIDGLLGCKAPGIESSTSDRACKVLDFGMRAFHGWMLVQARRDHGYMALSGGTMPDSSRYAQGSSAYWMEAFWAMSNNGWNVGEYASWVANNLMATYVAPTTPSGKGMSGYGDVDQYQLPGGAEPNSVPLDTHHFDVVAMEMGLLAKAGRPREAGWAKAYLAKFGPSDDYNSRAHMLMFDTDAVARVDYATGAAAAPTTFLDSGFGAFYDRSAWGSDASMITFRGGWTGVDHSQEEQGSFQLYRKGQWMTHESSGYEGESQTAKAHNVMQLGVEYNHGVKRDGQYAFRNLDAAKIVRRASGPKHAYVHGDYTGVYNSGFTNYYAFDKVQRALVWLKGDVDTLVVYDVVDNSLTAPARVTRNFQINVDASATIQGRKATVAQGAQRLDVDVLLPTTASLANVAPSAAPGNASDAVYTHRVVANPNSAEAQLRFVTVIGARDAVQASPAAEAVDSGGFVGAKVGTTLVVFPRAALAARWAGPATVSLETGGVTRAYVAGLVPGGAYGATTSAGKTTLTAGGGTLTADRAGMVIFDIR